MKEVVTPCLFIEIKPWFLDANDISVGRVGTVQDVICCNLGFVGVLLPDSEVFLLIGDDFVRECGNAKGGA